MARGHDINKARKIAVAGLGRELVRRARSTCELCAVKGESLTVIEVGPNPDAPDPDRAVMICRPCEEGATGGKLDGDRWRFLESLVWSDVPPVQVVAVRLTGRLAANRVGWAQGAIDGLYLDDEIRAWADAEA